MRVLFFFLMFTVTMVAGVAAFIWFIARWFFRLSFRPGSAAWDKLVQRLRSQVEPLATQLIPWDSETLALLSLNQTQKRKKGVFGHEQQGVFTTIYHEPAVAFASQTAKNTGLLLARTSNREFIFRFKEKETEVWLDKQPLGVLAGDVFLAAGKSPRQLARLENDPSESQIFVKIGERPAAALADPSNQNSPIARALTLLGNIPSNEEPVLLALAILRMTERSKI